MTPKVLPGYKELVRSRIIETAREAVLERGFQQTTMDEIAEKLGISKAAIYKYFDDKEDLFRAAYEASLRDLEGAVASAIRKSGGEAMKVFDSLFEEMMPRSKDNVALDLEVASEAARNVEVRKVLKGANDRYLEAVRRCIPTTGGESQQGDTENLAGAVLALWNGIELLLAVGYSRDEVRNFWNVSMERLVAPRRGALVRMTKSMKSSSQALGKRRLSLYPHQQ
jgi:AcrR family transcriptional regulator